MASPAATQEAPELPGTAPLLHEASPEFLGPDRWYVADPGKQADLEKLREKALLREFEGYKTSTQRRLKQFRTEALRAGFKSAYDAQDYRCIVDVAKKIPENVLQEDEKLLMYYDVASMRLGDDE